MEDKKQFSSIFKKYYSLNMKLVSKIARITKRKTLFNHAKNYVMQGKRPIGSPTLEETYDLWRNKVENTTNRAEYYLKPIKRSEFLYEQILKYCNVKKSDPILEIGCNVGRNLNFLFQNGFSHLSGIEINQKAIKLLHENYPNLNAKIHLGPVEEKIKEFKDNEISITFTMAVLMHINPDSNFIFEEICRVTKNYIITIEKEHVYDPPGVFPRDYGKIFTDLGLKQIVEKKVDKSDLVKGEYVLRIFSKNK